MHIVDDEIETIHVYMVPEEEKRPYTVFPLICAFLCLLGIAAVTMHSAHHPYYEHERLTVPAQFLPLKVFKAEVPIIPTGVKTYPATYATGTLTLTNGSVVSQELPAGLIFTSAGNPGISVTTDQVVYVPAGSVDGYGAAIVKAHVSTPGVNMSTLSIDQVVGTSLYVRNLEPFTGGHPAYSVKYATAQDKQIALTVARDRLEVTTNNGFSHYPCQEHYLFGEVQITISWRCIFATYK